MPSHLVVLRGIEPLTPSVPWQADFTANNGSRDAPLEREIRIQPVSNEGAK